MKHLATAIDEVVRVRGAEFRLGVLVQQEIVPADEEAEVVVKAARLRMMRLIKALMPFADQRRRIARVVHDIRDRALIQWQTELRLVAHMRIELMPEPRRSRERRAGKGVSWLVGRLWFGL